MIDSLEPGMQLVFRGRLHSVHDVDNTTGIVWLQPEPKIDGECVGVYGTSLVLHEASFACNTDFIPKHTKSEIDARLNELNAVLNKAKDEIRLSAYNSGVEIRDFLMHRIQQLEKEREQAPDDIFSAIVESHKILCNIKQMGEKEAYGQNPAFYYSAGVAGEAGELLNKMVKAFRHGGDASEGLRAAVLSELPDVVIYAFVLAYVMDIDLTKLVTEKAHVVIDRARLGYYGGPLFRQYA
jgi:NTP pyrophosphatase (non-canonical NTP hydrolase)